ncbi:hypothetical protein BJY01DRAFT_28890 [Aspergillus pseudoustus]|uniref:Uncharacterized protein n=1 Tax=Aspergillus pseudoustus TaxID=1810923 RepID=A0ABR4JGT8_9EURO
MCSQKMSMQERGIFVYNKRKDFQLLETESCRSASSHHPTYAGLQAPYPPIILPSNQFPLHHTYKGSANISPFRSEPCCSTYQAEYRIYQARSCWRHRRAQDIECLLDKMFRVASEPHQTVHDRQGMLHAIGKGTFIVEVKEPWAGEGRR